MSRTGQIAKNIIFVGDNKRGELKLKNDIYLVQSWGHANKQR